MADEKKKRERTPMQPKARAYRDAALAFFHKPDVTNEKAVIESMKAHRLEFLGMDAVPAQAPANAEAQT